MKIMKRKEGISMLGYDYLESTTEKVRSLKDHFQMATETFTPIQVNEEVVRTMTAAQSVIQIIVHETHEPSLYELYENLDELSSAFAKAFCDEVRKGTYFITAAEVNLLNQTCWYMQDQTYREQKKQEIH